MATMTELLRDADPLRHEPPPSAHDRERVRRAVLVPASPPPRTTRRAVLAVGAGLGLAGAIGMRFWWGGVVQAAVRFEVRLAESAFSPGLREARVAGSNGLVYLHDDVVVTNEHIAASRVVPGNSASRFNIAIRFDAAGAENMRKATAGHVGRPVAILIDGQVVAAPTVRSEIGAEALITGEYTQAEAERLANGMMTR